CVSKHLSELTEGQIDREEKFWFEAAHVNAMIAVVEAEAVTAAPELRNWLLSLAAFARRAADRHVGIVFVFSCTPAAFASADVPAVLGSPCSGPGRSLDRGEGRECKSTSPRVCCLRRA